MIQTAIKRADLFVTFEEANAPDIKAVPAGKVADEAEPIDAPESEQ